MAPIRPLVYQRVIFKAMTSHFEDFWNEAEVIGRNYNNTVPQHIESIKHALDKLTGEVKLPQEQAILVGQIIFDLCGITDKLNINSAASLKLISENKKAALLDPDDETS